MATLFFNTEGGTIRALMNLELKAETQALLVFALTWYLMTITTAGIQVPSGLFLPGMIIGCALGQIANNIVIK